MQKVSLDAIARQQLESARVSESKRSATSVYGGHEHALRQTVLALCAGAALNEHENPGEATLHVLSGHVELVAGDDVWNGSKGDLLIIPDVRHAVRAIEDSVILLTAVPRGHRA